MSEDCLPRQTDERFTYHREPPAQGGAVYARCVGCQREILRSIGVENLVHAEGCPVARPRPLPRKRSTDIGDRRLLIWEPGAPGAWIEGEPMEARR